MNLLTYNAAMVPGTGIDSGEEIARHQDHRAEIIARRVLEVDVPYDIVCIQDLSCDEPRALLARELRRRYPYIIEKPVDPAYPLNPDGGLFLASRYPIRGSGFQKFRFVTQSSPDHESNKGALAVVLDSSADEPGSLLAFFTAHLQSGTGTENRDIRRRQLDHIHRFIKGVLANIERSVPLDRVGLMLVGDMNVAAETVVDGAIRPSGEYVEMMERLRGARDLFRELHPDEPGFTYGVPNSDAVATEEHARGRCDYVLTFDRLPSESEDDAKPLRALDCAGIRTVSLGDDAPDRFAIEADLPTHQVIL